MAVMVQPSRNGHNGRDSGGRFTQGNPGGPGNPFARRVARLRSLIVEELADEDMRTIVRKMIDDARKGDTAAARLLLTYAIGKPVEPACEPDRVAAHEQETAAATLEAERRRQTVAEASELDLLM